MKSFLKFELRRALFSRNTLFSVILISACFLISYYDFMKVPNPNFDGVDIYVYISGSYLPLFTPLIVCIPFANSYLADLESGIIPFINTRITKKKYLTTRLLANCIVSATIFLIVESTIFIILLKLYGINNNYIEIRGAFYEVYYRYKLFYGILLIIVSVIFAGVYSTLALGVSALIKNRYLTIIVPFIYVIISGTIFELAGINDKINLYICSLINIHLRSNTTALGVIVYDVCLFVIGAVLLFYYGDRKDYE